MHRKILLTSGLGLMIGACTQVSTTGCKSYTPPKTCQGNPQVPRVTLNLDTLEANPPNVCANRGETLVYNLVPTPSEPGTVAVRAKNRSDSWLAGTNSPNPREIRVSIPGWVEADSDHDYSFEMSDGKCLDPRVRVRAP